MLLISSTERHPSRGAVSTQGAVCHPNKREFIIKKRLRSNRVRLEPNLLMFCWLRLTFSGRSRRGLLHKEQAYAGGGFGLHDCLRSRVPLGTRADSCLSVECDFVKTGADGGRGSSPRGGDAQPSASGRLRADGLPQQPEGIEGIFVFSYSIRYCPRFRASSLGVYLLFALSSLRERLSCFLRLPPLPLHGYPCGLLPPYPAPSIPPHATPVYNGQEMRLL